MSLIPIGIYCPPFTSLSILKYSFGWNNISFNVDQAQLNKMYYPQLEIKSNFISNLNFMIAIIIICPIMYGILRISGKYATYYKTKTRLLTYSKTFLLEIPFTLILINIPNICISFVVSFQAFKM